MSGTRLYQLPPQFTGRFIAGWGKSMGYAPGAETSVTPDDPDVLDAGDVL